MRHYGRTELFQKGKIKTFLNSLVDQKMQTKFELIIKASKVTVLFTILIINGTNALAQKWWNTIEDIRLVTEMASCKSWEILKQDNEVTLRSRWLTFGDSLKTREISSHFVVDADIQSVLVHLILPEKVMVWNYGIKSMKLLKHEGYTWITHSVYDIPYPFSQQDLVVKNILIKENQKVIILLSALPDYIAPLSNVNRQRLYFGKWELNPLDNGTTEVSFSAISFSNSGIPRIIRDPIIQNKLFHSFSLLKELSSETKPFAKRM